MFIPPSISALPSVVPTGGTIPFLEMVRFELTEGDPIIDFRVRDNGAGGGFFQFFGQRLAANEFHIIPADQIQQLQYRGGNQGDRETFSVAANDGNLSPVSANSITSGNSSPVVNPTTNTLVREQESVLFSNFFNITDADNDLSRRFFVVDRRVSPDSGSLVLNGETLQAGVFHSLSPAQYAQLQYVGADDGRTQENVGLQVFDGFSLSNVVNNLITTTTPAVIQPTLTTSVLVNQTVPLSRLFNAFDPDGDAIESFFFVDRRTNANGSFLSVNGVRQPSGTFFSVPADQLDQVTFTGGANGPQTENIGIIANDGRSLSQAVDIPILTESRPTISTSDGAILENFFLDVEDLVSGQSATGQPADFYRFVDRRINQNGGHFVFRGSRLPSAVWFQIPAEDLPELQYRGGTFGEQSENIGVQVIAGGVLSEIESFSITTLENRFRPTVEAFDVNARAGSVIDLQSLFSFDDADGIPPTTLSSLRIFDTGTEADSGFFSINGVRQPAGEFIRIDFDTVLSGAVQYNVSDRVDSEVFRISVNDGRFESVLDSAVVNASAPPVLTAFQNDFSVDTIERIPIGNFITQTDPGPQIFQYRILDENTDLRSGRAELDGVDLQQGVIHTLTAAQFDRLVFKGAEADLGRQLDGFLVQGISTAGSSEFTRFNVTTDPVGADALQTGQRFNNTDPTDPITEITFAFIDGGTQRASTRGNPQLPLPSYYGGTGCVNGAPVPGVEALATVAWNQPQREQTRLILDSIESYANIRFREVAISDGAFRGADAQITFGSWGPHDCGGPAYSYPVADGSGLGNFGGDIWFDWTVPGWDSDQFDPTGTPLSVQGPGTSFNFNVLRTVGNVLGIGNANALSIFNNFDYNTVQSNNHFNGNSQFDQAFPELPSTFQLYDIVELQRIYGARAEFNPENNQYRFNDANQQSIYDTGGIDTINLTSSTVPLTIDLREGQRTTLQDLETGAAFDNAVLIPYGVVIENARGGSDADIIGGNEISNFIVGNGGDDIISGRGGNDTLRGGEGNDTYLWQLGDGRDTIIEQGGADRGIDRLHFTVGTGDLDLLQDDLVARITEDADGTRDLRIDLTLNRGEAQGTVVIRDFSNEANQVETLALFGPNGQVGADIDLTSIFAQSDVLPRRFQVTDTAGSFGLIAQPV